MARQGSGFNEARASSAGSSAPHPVPLASRGNASMRPAHQAREVVQSGVGGAGALVASMRPAHQAREVRRRPALPGIFELASMRPAHQAREVPAVRDFSISDERLQ